MERAGETATMVDLSREECLALLGAHSVGRLAVAAPGAAPLVVPVNYLLDGEVVVFRTGPGSKLRMLRGTPVSFQLDDVDPARRTGWSVLVRGRAYEATRWETEHLRLDPWAPGSRGHWIRVVADTVSGRRLRGPASLVDLGGYL